MNKKRIGLCVAGLLLALLVGIALGAIFLEKPISHHIDVVGIYDFELYEDELYTIPLVTVEWGDVCHNGKPHLKTVYIKNTGNDKCYISWNSTDIPSGVTFSITWSDPWPMNVRRDINAGGMMHLDMSLAIDPSFPVGAFSFTTTFFGHEAATG